MSAQPMPVPGRTDVAPIARARFLTMLLEREITGEPLQTHNGRNAFRDLSEELLDAWQYAVQAALEHDDLVSEIAGLRAENAALRTTIEAREQDRAAGDGFGAYLRCLRERTGISQAELARRADLSVSYQCHIEAGRKLPGPKTLVKIATALRLTNGEVRDLFRQAGLALSSHEEGNRAS